MTWLPLFLILTLLMHEMGHLVAAKVLGLPTRGLRFAMRPIPHLYVSVSYYRLTLHRRVIFLLSGSALVVVMLIAFATLGRPYRDAHLALSIQTIVDTNPFFSDYVVAIMSCLYRREFSQTEDSEIVLRELKERYFFSPVWYIHFVAWGCVIALLLSEVFFNQHSQPS